MPNRKPISQTQDPAQRTGCFPAIRARLRPQRSARFCFSGLWRAGTKPRWALAGFLPPAPVRRKTACPPRSTGRSAGSHRKSRRSAAPRREGPALPSWSCRRRRRRKTETPGHCVWRWKRAKGIRPRARAGAYARCAARNRASRDCWSAGCARALWTDSTRRENPRVSSASAQNPKSRERLRLGIRGPAGPAQFQNRNRRCSRNPRNRYSALQSGEGNRDCRSANVWEGRRSRPPRWNSAPQPSCLALGPPEEKIPPACGEPQIEIGHAIGRLKQADDQAVRLMGRESDFLIVTLDGNQAPQQLRLSNGRILVTQTVAAGYQARFLGTARGGHYFSVHNPMDKQSSLLQEQYDFSRRNFI